MACKFFFKPFGTIPVAPTAAGIIIHFMRHIIIIIIISQSVY
jgi:hypothetical protein